MRKAWMIAVALAAFGCETTEDTPDGGADMAGQGGAGEGGMGGAGEGGMGGAGEGGMGGEVGGAGGGEGGMGGGAGGEGGMGGAGGGEQMLARITGTVKDKNGALLADVRVHVGEASAMTGADGSYTLDMVAIPEGTVVFAERDGYAKGIATINQAYMSEIVVPHVLFPVTRTMVDLSEGPAEVDIAEGEASVGSLNIPEGSLVNMETGQAPAGPVAVEIAYVDPDESANGNSPVPMETEDGAMVSYGMAEITITEGESEVNVAEGENLELEIVQEEEPEDDSIPMWFFDEEQGIWVQDGTATCRDGVCAADLPHLTWWNIDKIAEQGDCCYDIDVRNPDGTRAEGVKLQYFHANGGYFWDSTFGGGSNCAVAACDRAASVRIYGFDGLVYDQATPAPSTAGACGSDTCLDVTITLPCSDTLACPEGLICNELGGCAEPAECGDGIIEGDEACDDGNTDDDDGCSAECTIEDGWACANAFNLNTGSNGAGGQLALGSSDPIWQWTRGELTDGDAPAALPPALEMARWVPAQVIEECVPDWADAPMNAEWINTSGWDSANMRCAAHPEPLVESLRYYRARFNIADGASAATTLSGNLWADNQIRRIWINGTAVSEFTPPVGNGSSFVQGDVVPFSNWPSRYFRDGQNSIVIAVKNLASERPPNPEGLLVSVPNAFETASTCRRDAPVCGDGRREGEEACDDGNMAADDGCAADCTVEDGYVCKGAPSVCENCEMAGGMPDADGDGERDACDLCPNDANRGTFNWVNWNGMPRDNGRDDPARRWQWSGTVGNTPVNYYSNQSWRVTARELENQALFPERYQIPTDNRAHVENFVASANILEFDREVSNPLLVFASIGAPRIPVDIQFNQPIEIVWSAPTMPGMTTLATLSADGRTLSGESTWTIVRVPGNHRSVGFSYLVTENSADFMFGFGGRNDDANNNGTPDVCE